MAAVSNTPGAGNSGNIPSAGEMNAYSDKVNNMDTKSLVGELGKNLEPWQRDAAEKALINKAKENESPQGSGGPQGAGGAGGSGGGEEDEIKKLLKKLLEGSISPEEMQKLASMTGAKVEDLQGLKGKGGEAGGSGGEAGDIQGG